MLYFPHMFRSFRFILAGVLLACSFGFVAPTVFAAGADLNANYDQINVSVESKKTTQGIIFAGICKEGDLNKSTGADACVCRATGNCTLSDVLQVFVNLSTFILGISGSAVLFVFVYGGFKWIFARGDTKSIHSGTEAMTAGVIGLCIIFGAYVAINFIVAGLTTPPSGEIQPMHLETTVNNATTGTPSDVFTTQ